MPRIFVSYRGQDAKYQARFIHEAFAREVGRENVFMDVNSIPPGANYRVFLKGWVDQCDVLLALIGPGWIDVRDPQTGQRRLDNSSDFVRIEIDEALRRDIPVVPVLLDGAPMPQAHQLPDDLKELCDRQAEFVEFRNFDADVERLIKRLHLTDQPFPIEVFLPKWGLTHLRKLASGDPFPFKPRASFRRELEHLLFLKLIRRLEGRGFRSLFRDLDDVKLHFEVTELGRSYLQHRTGERIEVRAGGVIAPGDIGGGDIIIGSFNFDRDNAEYVVWYGTNRHPKLTRGEFSGYSSIRDDKTHYGQCRVFVPKSHKIGSTGSPWWKRLLTLTDDRLILLGTEPHTPDRFWNAIAAQLAPFASEEKRAIVFIHGYNVSFEAAALRTAQIGFDLQIRTLWRFLVGHLEEPQRDI